MIRRLMECEICGIKTVILYEVIFQGKRLYACEECVKKYKLSIVEKNLSFKRRNVAKKISYRRKVYRNKNILQEADEELIDNYGKIIKEARERIGFTQEDLAKELKVKLSYIKKIESEKIIPTPDVIWKLEKLLNIKLRSRLEEHLEDYVESVYNSIDNYTLGDILRYREEE